MPEGMDGREQLLLEVSRKVLTGIWKKRVNVIKSDYEANHAQYDQEIIDMLVKLLSEWKNIHGDRKEELKYVIISPLGSGVITRSYELQIALFDQNLYNNENPLCLYWTPKFIFKDIEDDMVTYKKAAAKEIVRLREDEVYEIRRRYALCHAYISMQYMDGIIRKIYCLPVWKEVAGDDTKVLYGTYMEQMVELGMTQEEGET
ncbi:MAG: hypothetical protein K2L82_13150 [Lachnospiraceae bacterium]|nr:hypothetical protein [Lachnospiraceae bacterium]